MRVTNVCKWAHEEDLCRVCPISEWKDDQMHGLDQCLQSDWWEFYWFTPYVCRIILCNRKARLMLVKSTISGMATDFWCHVVDWDRRWPIRRTLRWPQRISQRECKSRTVFLLWPSMNRQSRWLEKFKHLLYSPRALFPRNWRHIVPDLSVESLERFVRPNMRWDCPRSPLEYIIPIHTSIQTVDDYTNSPDWYAEKTILKYFLFFVSSSSVFSLSLPPARRET